jgi:S1-C subfamily serine protease
VTPGSLAAQIGFQSGDQIVALNGQPVQSNQQFEQLLRSGSQAGQPVEIRVRRNGQEQTLQVPQDRLTQLASSMGAGEPDGAPGGAAMGILMDRSAFPRVVVADVRPGSPAAVAGLQPADEIVAVAGQPISSPEQIRRAMLVAPIGNTLAVTYRRGDRQFDAAVPLVPYATVFEPASSGGTAVERSAAYANRPALGIRVAQDAAGQVVVMAVQTNGPAAMAGIRAGDQILSVRGTRVTTPAELATIVGQTGSGNNLDVVYRRNGQDFRVSPRVGSYSDLFGPDSGMADQRPAIGTRLRETAGGGPVVIAVAPNSPAAQAGLQPGDQIVAINNQNVNSSQAVVAELHRARIGNSIQIRYMRDGNTQEATLPVRDFAVIYGTEGPTERQTARQPLEPNPAQQPPAPATPPAPSPGSSQQTQPQGSQSPQQPPPPPSTGDTSGQPNTTPSAPSGSR